MICPVPDCPIQSEVDKVIQLSEDLTVAIRKLRRDLHKCQTCPAFDECQLRNRFNDSIQVALAQVTQEWDLESVV